MGLLWMNEWMNERCKWSATEKVLKCASCLFLFLFPSWLIQGATAPALQKLMSSWKVLCTLRQDVYARCGRKVSCTGGRVFKGPGEEIILSSAPPHPDGSLLTFHLLTLQQDESLTAFLSSFSLQWLPIALQAGSKLPTPACSGPSSSLQPPHPCGFLYDVHTQLLECALLPCTSSGKSLPLIPQSRLGSSALLSHNSLCFSPLWWENFWNLLLVSPTRL